MDKFEVYVKIRQLLEQGFSKTAIAKKLGISRPTLYRYLKKSPKCLKIQSSAGNLCRT